MLGPNYYLRKMKSFKELCSELDRLLNAIGSAVQIVRKI
jgi:hypothetical protein